MPWCGAVAQQVGSFVGSGVMEVYSKNSIRLVTIARLLEPPCSRAVSESAQGTTQTCNEGGQLFGGGGVEDFQVDGPVAVDDPVPQSHRLLPGYFREPVFELSRELSNGLAQHSEVPQQGVTALTVGFQLADRDVRGQPPGLLRSIDHLREQKDVTLHRRAGLRPRLTAAAVGAGSAATPSRPGGRTIR